MSFYHMTHINCSMEFSKIGLWKISSPEVRNVRKNRSNMHLTEFGLVNLATFMRRGELHVVEHLLVVKYASMETHLCDDIS